MEVYIVIIKDRHSDTTAQPFVNSDKAIEWAKIKAKEYAREESDYSEEEIKGWLFHATYSCEGDCVYVVAKELDESLPAKPKEPEPPKNPKCDFCGLTKENINNDRCYVCEDIPF